MKTIAVFASGTGSNFDAIAEAIANGRLNAKLVLLVCDKPNAKVIAKAEAKGILTLVARPRNYASKEEFETVVLKSLKKCEVDLIVLAGYMRLIGTTLLEAYPRRIINIHPSLLPTFKGLDAVGQAMTAGVDKTGVTIHYVDAGMDTGEIIAQRELDIPTLSTRDEIESAIHAIEHELYPITIQKILEEMP